MTQVNIRAAKTHLSKLVEQPARDEETIITRSGQPVARPTAIQPVKKGRHFGALKGQAGVDDKFFEPLQEAELRAWE